MFMSDHTLNEEAVLAALRRVVDPDLRKDIVTLNFVKDLKIDGHDVSFRIELTTPACPVRDQLKDQAVQAIRETIPGVNEIHVEMSSTVVAHASAQRAAILPGVKNTIAIASGKGGVGKSAVTVNLAVALAQEGANVGIVDVDVYGPTIPTMLGVTDRPKVHHQKIITVEKHGIKLMSIGFLVDPNTAIIWRGPLASGAVKQFLSDVDWGELDYLLFDMPPGTGDVQLTLVQTIPLTGAVIVTTPQDVSFNVARRGIVMFQKVNVHVLGVIENMSYFLCSNCGHREDIFGHGGGKLIAEEMGAPFLGEIPIHISMRIGGDTGNPIVISDPESEQSKIIREIARKLAAQVSIRDMTMEAEPSIHAPLVHLNVSGQS